MINSNYDNHKFEDKTSRRVIFGAMWVLTAAMMGGFMYMIYAVQA